MEKKKKVEVYLEESLKEWYLSFLTEKKGGVSASKHLRNLIVEVSGYENQQNKKEKSVNKLSLGLKDSYLTTRLNSSEKKAYEARSNEYGFVNKNSLVMKLIREEINRMPDLKKEELSALRESTKQLLAIGRNLNQIAKKMNSENYEGNTVTLKYLETIAEYVENLETRILQIINFTESRQVK
tara:strand:+ start:180 stop:728 length:549 start_codon:yes stop_codon:yes gene_type:complete